MGSGGLIVMDEDTCVVDLARYFLDFTQKESCGKCSPCRVGSRHLVEILEKITHGQGETEDLAKLQNLGRDRQAGLSLRPGPDGTQSGADDPALFPV